MDKLLPTKALPSMMEGDSRLKDADLLRQFVDRRDEAAFARLVERYGPMVLGVCRRILRDVHASEDAFQATFLVLVARASTIRHSASLAGWLHRVAVRVALRARAKWCPGEELLVDVPAAVAEPAEAAAERELLAVLDQELDRLPEKYRRPLLLCCLQGKTHAEASRELGWPVGSLSRRLHRALELLRQLLQRRGVTLSALATLLRPAGELLSPPPASSSADHTVRLGDLLARGVEGPHAGASLAALGLARATLRAMALKRAALAVLALLLGAAGVTGAFWPHAGTVPVRGLAQAWVQPGKGPEEVKLLQGEWTLTALEADGEKLELPDDGREVRFQGDRIVVDGEERYRYHLDAAAHPRLIDVVPLAGDQKGQVLEGIFRLQGETLTICLHGGDGQRMRPVEFVTRPGSQCMLVTLQRKRP